MTQNVTRLNRSRARTVLMMSCATAAFATAALSPHAARAQAFQGSIASSTGSVTRSTPTTTTETLTIGSSTATINWSPNNQQAGGGPIDFLPNGNTATFTSAPGLNDYTVLNRILPESGQAIALNGHVISTLQGTTTTGGHVWFYAPGGIVVGATAVFDVGSLLLTTNDVTSFGTTASGFNASFSGAAGSTSSIQVQNGAQINALQQGSYVAMVAPRIEQGGTVRVNGSAAYAAGEQLSMTMNQGLFDIQVDVGTSDSNGIVHTGETSGPANTAASDNHKIYMVAVPKNQALTMLLGGTVGFDNATSATVKNGEIFLSSGWGVHDSDGSGYYYTATPGLNSGINIGPGNYTSDVTAYGQGTLQAVADTGNVSFGGDVVLLSWSGAGPLSTSLVASNEHTLSVGGNVTLESLQPNDTGAASIIANSDGLVSITGNAAVFSSGPGTSGGDSSLLANGGTISIGGLANVNAGGTGGAQISSDADAADGQGGSVSVSAFNNGSVTTGGMNLNVLGSGQANTGTGNGGSGYGGSIDIYADSGSSISVNGNLTASASGVGGNASSGQAGAGQGGSIDVELDGGSLTVNGTSLLLASGIGGAGGTQGGDGDGGSVTFDIFGGNASFSGATTINVASTGGKASNGSGGSAGLDYGSFADIQAYDGGTLTGGNFTVTADATGGNGLTAGSAQGGEVSLGATGWESEVPTTVSLGQVTLSANGTSGIGAPSFESSSSGGSIGVYASSAALTATSLSAQANGTNGGGLVYLYSDAADLGPGSLDFGTTHLSANGGDYGGEVLVGTFGGAIDLGSATLSSNGAFGGDITLLTGCAECGFGGDAATLSETPLSAAGGIAASDLTLTTTGNIFVELSSGADLSVSGTLSGTAGQMISLLDDGTGGAIRAHEIDLTAVTIDDSADIIADIINFTTPSQMTLGDLSATDSITLTSGNDLTTGNLTAGNALTLTSNGSIDTQDLSAHSVNVSALGNSMVGDVDASGSASFTAGGLASFNGTVSSPTITVTSSDIDVAGGASLGVAGVTNLLTLNAISHGLPIVIGDDGSSPGGASGQYHLNEDGDLRAASLVINAQGAVPSFAPDVQVFDTTIEGSNTSGGGIGNVTLNTGGSVFVNGGVDFINAGASDSLTINAGHAIEVNTDTGGIQITGNGGTLAGTLNLTADNVWVASGSILDQLEGDVNFAGRNTALGTNSGAPNQNGFLRAGSINASVADSLLVQNSGTADLFAGIDTGAGGLAITSTGTTPATLIVYGRQTTSTGTVITNQDFLGSVNLTGDGGFTTDSSVNGCTIGSTCGEAPITFVVDMASILGPLNETGDDKKKKDKQGDEGDEGSSADPSLRLINTTPINNAPPITEPVTSGGDVIVGAQSN